MPEVGVIECGEHLLAAVVGVRIERAIGGTAEQRAGDVLGSPEAGAQQLPDFVPDFTSFT